jgi:hypothetical protein
MQSLDPRWLSVELEAIQKDEGGWDRVLAESYQISVQRVLEYQARNRAAEEAAASRQSLRDRSAA